MVWTILINLWENSVMILFPVSISLDSFMDHFFLLVNQTSIDEDMIFSVYRLHFVIVEGASDSIPLAVYPIINNNTFTHRKECMRLSLEYIHNYVFYFEPVKLRWWWLLLLPLHHDDITLLQSKTLFLMS
jgi:hypothetical protein